MAGTKRPTKRNTKRVYAGGEMRYVPATTRTKQDRKKKGRRR